MAPIKIPEDLAKALVESLKWQEAHETGSFYGTFTPEEHLDRFRKLESEYRASSCAKSLEDLFRSKKPTGGWPVDNAVAFGLSSFSANLPKAGSACYFKQLASFLHVVEIRKQFSSTL